MKKDFKLEFFKLLKISQIILRVTNFPDTFSYHSNKKANPSPLFLNFSSYFLAKFLHCSVKCLFFSTFSIFIHFFLKADNIIFTKFTHIFTQQWRMINAHFSVAFIIHLLNQKHTLDGLLCENENKCSFFILIMLYCKIILESSFLLRRLHQQTFLSAGCSKKRKACNVEEEAASTPQ